MVVDIAAELPAVARLAVSSPKPRFVAYLV